MRMYVFTLKRKSHFPFFLLSIPADRKRRPDAPAGTSLHRRPARIAVFSFSSLSLIGVASQQGDVGTYRQGASVVFQNERMPAQRISIN